MYENPIQGKLGEIQTKIIEERENYIMQVVQDCGITVDKEELTRALMYDRQQYEKGYADAKAEQGWIPVSETPPEVGIRVQIQLDNGWIITGFYDDGYWYSVPDCGDALNGDAIQMDVLAWMPLPPSYKGEER